MANATTITYLTPGVWKQITNAGEQALITIIPESGRLQSDQSSILLQYSATTPTTNQGHIFSHSNNNQNFVIGSSNTDKGWLYSGDDDATIAVTKL